MKLNGHDASDIETTLIQYGAKSRSELPAFEPHEKFIRETESILKKTLIKDENCLEILKLIDSGSDSKTTLLKIAEKSELLGEKLNILRCDEDNRFTLLEYVLKDVKLVEWENNGHINPSYNSFRNLIWFQSNLDILKSYRLDFKIAEILMENGAKPGRDSIVSVLISCPLVPDSQIAEPIALKIENEVIRFMNLMKNYGADFINDASYRDTAYYGCIRNAQFLIDQGKKVSAYDVSYAKQRTIPYPHGSIVPEVKWREGRYVTYYKLMKKTYDEQKTV